MIDHYRQRLEHSVAQPAAEPIVVQRDVRLIVVHVLGRLRRWPVAYDRIVVLLIGQFNAIRSIRWQLRRSVGCAVNDRNSCRCGCGGDFGLFLCLFSKDRSLGVFLAANHLVQRVEERPKALELVQPLEALAANGARVVFPCGQRNVHTLPNKLRYVSSLVVRTAEHRFQGLSDGEAQSAVLCRVLVGRVH
uniref:(northern house mosquito) hypothetical protein n=1 Tax=Culex pipiens TaxID=7175 RepID=A0A8D8N680_CULPI